MPWCSDFNYCLCLFRDGVRFPWTLIKIFFENQSWKSTWTHFLAFLQTTKIAKFWQPKTPQQLFGQKILKLPEILIFVCLSVCLFVCLFVCFFVCLFVCLLTNHFQKLLFPNLSLLLWLWKSPYISLRTVFCHSSSSSKYTITICLYPIWGKWPYQGTVPSPPSLFKPLCCPRLLSSPTPVTTPS
jgi:hypothetical protein